MVSASRSSPHKNRILGAVPQEDLDRFFASLQPVSLPLKHMLYRIGAPLDFVYFIEEGVASILTSMTDGSTIEVGMVGSEGIVGVAALMGGEASAQQIVMQVPGAALNMPTAKCREAFDQSPAFRAAVLRYVAALLDLGAQTAGELQRSGLIRNHRGEVTVVDRPGLEAAACECYGLDHARLMRLL